MYGSLVVNLAMYAFQVINKCIFRSASLQMLWSIVNVMQLIVQLPLLNINFPQNTATFYSFLYNISNFNLLPSDRINQKIFFFTQKEETDSNFVALGFNTMNIIDNLGSLFLYLIGYIVLALVTLTLRIFRNANQCVEKVYNYLSGLVFFNILIRLIIEGYIDFSLSSLLNIKNLTWITKSDKVASSVSIITIIIIGVFPFALWATLWIRIGSLAHSKNTMGAAFEELKIFDRDALLYNVIQMLRRLLIALIAIFMKNYPSVQVQIIIIQSLLVLGYLIRVKPFENYKQNRLEIFNESCILIASYSLVLFTEFVSDHDFQYNIGWFMITISLFSIFVNLLAMVIQAFLQLKQQIFRFRRYLLNRKLQKYAIIQSPTINASTQKQQSQIEVVLPCQDNKRPQTNNNQLDLKCSQQAQLFQSTTADNMMQRRKGAPSSLLRGIGPRYKVQQPK